LRPLEAERLAERLAEITPGDLSITTLTNSGAEAVEAAIKLARVRTGRPVILSTRDGFHGNTLTSVSAVRALEEAASRVGMDLGEAHVVVVGAAGAIGRLTSLMLARRTGRITLCGNAANPFTPRLLSNVADEVCATLLDTVPAANFASGRAAGLMSYLRDGLRADEGVGGLALRTSQAFQGRGLVAPVEWRLPLDAALKSADIVVVATSAETAILDPRTLSPGTLVCDVARPPNVAQTSLPDDAVMVFDGGLITPPSDIDLGPFQTLPPGLCWGCFGETMLLALAGEEGDYSIGSKLPLNDADRIAVLAERHGFRPAPLQWYGEEIGADRMDRFARHVAERQKDRVTTLRIG
jgi:predicted amino acid dehydrogenase